MRRTSTNLLVCIVNPIQCTKDDLVRANKNAIDAAAAVHWLQYKIRLSCRSLTLVTDQTYCYLLTLLCIHNLPISLLALNCEVSANLIGHDKKDVTNVVYGNDFVRRVETAHRQWNCQHVRPDRGRFEHRRGYKGGYAPLGLKFLQTYIQLII